MTTIEAEISVEEFQTRAGDWLSKNARKRGEAEVGPMGEAHEMGSAEERDYVTRARELQAKLHDAGFAGITVPREYGGQGLSRAHQGAFNAEAAAYAMPAVNGLGFGL